MLNNNTNHKSYKLFKLSKNEIHIYEKFDKNLSYKFTKITLKNIFEHEERSKQLEQVS